MTLFDRIAAVVVARREGVTLIQLASIDALARELALEAPDPDRVGWLARDLHLTNGELARIQAPDAAPGPRTVTDPGAGRDTAPASRRVPSTEQTDLLAALEVAA